MTGLFKKEYFDLMIKYNNQTRNKGDLEQNQAYESLKEANDLTKTWGLAVQKTLFPNGYLGKFIIRPTNQANNFKPYTWAKLYPHKSSPKELAYTVGIEAQIGFVVKIDTVGDIGGMRNKYESLRGDFDDESPIIAFLSKEEGLNKSLDELVAWSIEEIQNFGMTYDELCTELGLEVEGEPPVLTAQLALNYLKNRYSNSEQKTLKIFLSINDLNKEIALETTNLSTTTVRIFIKDQPPKNIIPIDQFKFIPKNVSNESLNHNFNTNTLSSQDDFYQVSPKTQEELLHLCDWLDEMDNTVAIGNLENQGMGSKDVDKTLNRILFGTAGTGKTYNTINHALAIIENKTLESLENKDRIVLKKRFDDYKNQGQIKFVTFHQSFSYEDFVEGIRAETDDQGNLSYDVKPGVFKEICERAIFQKFSENDIDKIVDDFVEEISTNEKVLETKTGVEFTVFNSSGKGGISVRTTTQNEIVISKKAIKAYLLEPSKNIRKNQAYAWAVARYLQLRLDEKTPAKNANTKNYVLIIDEINRGNISRILGELITLIEDSKRIGEDEELSVTLPYSKEEFSVPNNVYIIGTMNSSDRSLTGLDIALRRRFTFIEMPPKPELLNNVLVEGLNIGTLLTVINQRIEVLLDRDHCIGHANFMHLKSTSTVIELANIFKQKIIPQLQEYFFDDWSKINMILNGNGMLIAKPVEKSAIFPNVDTEEVGYFEDQKTWELVGLAFASIESFTKIIKH